MNPYTQQPQMPLQHPLQYNMRPTHSITQQQHMHYRQPVVAAHGMLPQVPPAAATLQELHSSLAQHQKAADDFQEQQEGLEKALKTLNARNKDRSALVGRISMLEAAMRVLSHNQEGISARIARMQCAFVLGKPFCPLPVR